MAAMSSLMIFCMLEVQDRLSPGAWHQVSLGLKGNRKEVTLTSWLLLFLAIGLEVCGTTCMKLSEGFSRLTPSVLIFVFYGLSFALFTFALKHIDVSVAYAVWAGLGVMLMVAVGVVHFHEPVTAVRLVSMLLIVCGVVGLSASGAVR